MRLQQHDAKTTFVNGVNPFVPYDPATRPVFYEPDTDAKKIKVLKLTPSLIMRTRITEWLSKNASSTASEVAEALGATRTTASSHLTRLEQNGQVTSEKLLTSRCWQEVKHYSVTEEK